MKKSALCIALISGCNTEFPTKNFPPTILSFAPVDGAVVNLSENVLFQVAVTDDDTEYAQAILIRVRFFDPSKGRRMQNMSLCGLWRFWENLDV